MPDQNQTQERGAIDLSCDLSIDILCAFQTCHNPARYITVDGRLMCGLCPIEHKIDAIKVNSVPDLLKLVRQMLAAEFGSARGSVWADKLREIVGKDVSEAT